MIKPNNIETEFDLNALKVDSNFLESFPVHKGLNIIPVRKPDKQWFIRVNDNPEWMADVFILELKEERESYIVHPNIASSIANEIVKKRLFVGINRQGTLFVWPIRLPNEEGKLDEWSRSALNIAEKAKRDWVRIFSNLDGGFYEPHIAVAKDTIPEPEWPEIEFQKIVEIAFKDRVISSADHIVLKRLRGEV